MSESYEFPVEPRDEHNLRLLANVRPRDWVQPTPPAKPYQLLVIGGGTAGLVCAAGAAGLGARVALIERHLMGGDCLNVGCVPSKALLRAARAWHDVQHGQNRFAAASQAHWKALSIGQIELLNRCAHEAPPPKCQDREHLKRLTRLAVLIVSSRDGGSADMTYFFGKDEVVLDPEDGLLVATRGEPCDRAAWELYRQGSWLRMGHGPTAEAIVRRAAVCTQMAGPTRGDAAPSMLSLASEWSADDWAFKLLSRTDAWQVATHPNGLAGLPPAPIKLDSLVTTDPKLTGARVESWEEKAPACVAGGR